MWLVQGCVPPAKLGQAPSSSPINLAKAGGFGARNGSLTRQARRSRILRDLRIIHPVHSNGPALSTGLLLTTRELRLS